MRKLGHRQRGVLWALIDHKKWYNGCGWTWGGAVTVLILESLVKRGLAKAEILNYGGRDTLTYTPTKAGIELNAKLRTGE